jgi:hypothetical protein
MASVLPSNLSFFMSRMQGVSTSHFKINPQTSGDVGANRILRFEVPSNTIVNFRSLRLFMNVECSNSVNTKATSLPPDFSSLIERVSVYIGGVLVANGFNGYNTLVHAKAALQGSKCGALGHPEMVRAKRYHSFLDSGNGNATLSDATANTCLETYAGDSAGNDLYCIDNFEGLLSSIEPQNFDTGLVGTIVIEISLADNTVCSVSDSRALPAIQTDVYSVTGTAGFDLALADPGSPSYTLKNINMQVEVLSLATNVLDTIVEQRIGQIGYLSLGFKNYFSFSNTHDSSTRFSVNSASWDRCWFAFRDTNFASAKPPVRIKGYKGAGAFTAATSGGAVTGIDVGRPEYDAGGTLNTNAEKYKPAYFNFRENKATSTTATTYQLTINSASIPNYKLSAPELLALSMNSLDYYDKNHKLTLHQYKCNYFVGCLRLSLNDSDFSRLASGLDCRGVSSSCSINTTGLASSNITIFAECTSELRIGAGRQIEVIV